MPIPPLSDPFGEHAKRRRRKESVASTRAHEMLEEISEVAAGLPDEEETTTEQTVTVQCISGHLVRMTVSQLEAIRAGYQIFPEDPIGAADCPECGSTPRPA